MEAFAVYEKTVDKKKIPLLAIEHGFELIRVENSYARRYNYIKDILISYFTKISGIK